MNNLTNELTEFYRTIIPPPLIRHKRGFINALRRLNKWITGVMDDEDEDRLNAQITGLQKDSKVWKDMALDNIQLLKDSLKEVKAKTKQCDLLQKEVNARQTQFNENVRQEQIDQVVQEFLLQYDLI